MSYDVIGELKAELMNNINYLPTDHEREILERMLYYSNDCIERAVEEEKTISYIVFRTISVIYCFRF